MIQYWRIAGEIEIEIPASAGPHTAEIDVRSIVGAHSVYALAMGHDGGGQLCLARGQTVANLPTGIQIATGFGSAAPITGLYSGDGNPWLHYDDSDGATVSITVLEARVLS